MSELFIIADKKGHYIGPDGKPRKFKTPSYGLLSTVKESKDIDISDSDVSINEEVDIVEYNDSINEEKDPNELQLV